MEDESLQSKLIPEGGVLLEAVTAYTYVDNEGDECWGYFLNDKASIMKVVGMLEQTKAAILSEVVARLEDTE